MTTTPHHIAIIMDGNRRWAKSKGYPSSYGHIAGVKSVQNIVQCCVNQKIPYLSLFTFSTENWKRTSAEVQSLFSLMMKSIKQFEPELSKHQIRIRIIGDIDELPEKLRNHLNTICENTKNNQGLNLILAINYGGKKEIINAVQSWCHSSKEEITEKEFEKYLCSYQFPQPDLMIRTGGVQRISNFYLWSSSYSELYFSDVMWPEFNSKEFQKAIDYFASTQRRFGGT